jgi:hypothetical protein
MHPMDTYEKSDPPSYDVEKSNEPVTVAYPFAALGEDAPGVGKQHHFNATDLDRVQRRLKQRHIQMYVRILVCNQQYDNLYTQLQTGLLYVGFYHLNHPPFLTDDDVYIDCRYIRNGSFPRSLLVVFISMIISYADVSDVRVLDMP